MSTIKVTREVYFTPWAINQQLSLMVDLPKMSFDIETSGLYSKEQRKEAIKLLDADMTLYNHKLASVVANNSGLSFPSLTRTTHFIFGISKSHSVVIVVPGRHMELLVWNWLRNYKNKLIIHHALFDLKVMYHRIGDLPHDYDDTALMVKCLINNSDVWKAKSGLKDVMGEYYAPAWALYDEYEPADPLNPAFLDYCAIDGAATYYLHDILMERF
jgi:hypothetical protein